MKLYRTRKRLHNRHLTTLPFGMVKPVYVDFSLPGDIWKLKANCLIRCQPMLAPSLTQYDAYFRFFYVPLRLVIDKLEEIVTGSKNGSLITSELPKEVNFVKEWLNKHQYSYSGYVDQNCKVHKDSFFAALGVRQNIIREETREHSGDVKEYSVQENYDQEENAEDFDAAYFYRAYCKIIWEYFRDENYQSFDGDFEKFYEYMLCNNGSTEVDANGWYFNDGKWKTLFGSSESQQYGCRNFKLWFSNLSRDYFMDTLPWIMKGAEPTINAVMHADFTNVVYANAVAPATPDAGSVHMSVNDSQPFLTGNVNGYNKNTSSGLLTALNRNQIIDGGFTARDIRDMFSETRVFERLAETGSRYVEYLKANFGIAPADDTLQRPVYLGGFTQPIVTTEVVQSGGETEEVGTLRGHGISSGGNSIRPYLSKEFGIVMGLMYIKPRTQYLFQMKRKYTYMSRFSFFNPSFQLLSEQQTKSIEFFIPKLNWTEPETYTHVITNFQPINRFILGYNKMYEELRTDTDLITGELSDTLSYWTSAIDFRKLDTGAEAINTPPINGVNICLATYLYSLNRPWKVVDGGYRPFIVDFGISGSVFRPLVKNPVPGLVDHL